MWNAKRVIACSYSLNCSTALREQFLGFIGVPFLSYGHFPWNGPFRFPPEKINWKTFRANSQKISQSRNTLGSSNMAGKPHPIYRWFSHQNHQFLGDVLIFSHDFPMIFPRFFHDFPLPIELGDPPGHVWRHIGCRRPHRIPAASSLVLLHHLTGKKWE